VIEDEIDLVDVLTVNFQKVGVTVYSAGNASQGIRLALDVLPDLVLLDLSLPDMEGFEVCKELRAEPRTRMIPIVILTARGDETDEVLGFRMGADDYITKPFRMKPLVERVLARMRKGSTVAAHGDRLSVHGVEIDRFSYTVMMDGRDLRLTPTEFRLLWTLMSQPGRVFSRLQLLEASVDEDSAAMERSIDVHIRSLRKKMGHRADMIETVRGVGYRLRGTEGPQTLDPSEMLDAPSSVE
jgi:two-component system phosphate regulon response regulator PhoB